MTIWQAKYKALLAGINDPILIENAEFLVKKAMEMSAASTHPLGEVVTALMRFIDLQQLARFRASEKQ